MNNYNILGSLYLGTICTTVSEGLEIINGTITEPSWLLLCGKHVLACPWCCLLFFLRKP